MRGGPSPSARSAHGAGRARGPRCRGGLGWDNRIVPPIFVWMPESGAADIALDAELDAPHRVRGCAKLPIFRYKTVKNAKKTAVKRRECANFPKRAIDIGCPHFGPDTPGHAAIGPTNYLKTFPVAPENVRICPCIWTLTVKNRPKNGQDADRCCDVAWVHTGAPTMLGCLVWVPASSACPNR